MRQKAWRAFGCFSLKRPVFIPVERASISRGGEQTASHQRNLHCSPTRKRDPVFQRNCYVLFRETRASKRDGLCRNHFGVKQLCDAREISWFSFSLCRRPC